jgi:hypothetical protein
MFVINNQGHGNMNYQWKKIYQKKDVENSIIYFILLDKSSDQ